MVGTDRLPLIGTRTGVGPVRAWDNVRTLVLFCQGVEFRGLAGEAMPEDGIERAGGACPGSLEREENFAFRTYRITPLQSLLDGFPTFTLLLYDI